MDGGNRRFILIQLPEPLPAPESKLKTIADITRERVRHAIDVATASSIGDPPTERHDQDLGFRAFQLSDSNFAPWNSSAAIDSPQLEAQLDLHVHHVRQDRTDRDILFEILLKEGYPPATRIEERSVAGKTTFSAMDGGLLICLQRELTLDAVRALADLSPQRIVCLDDGFDGNDQLKANAGQIFKSKGIVFRTV